MVMSDYQKFANSISKISGLGTVLAFSLSLSCIVVSDKPVQKYKPRKISQLSSHRDEAVRGFRTYGTARINAKKDPWKLAKICGPLPAIPKEFSNSKEERYG